MTVLSLESVSLSYGQPALLESISFAIERGERICLIGRNGQGKSTLLRIIAGEVQADAGAVRAGPEIRISQLPQEIPPLASMSVFEVVASGLGDLGALVADYLALSHRLGAGAGERDLERLSRIQHQLEERDGWAIEQRTERVLSRLGLDGSVDFNALSGGLKRRALLAQALVREPDLLLLDEPTNHLDIDSIEWLEGFLEGFPGAILFITHDRRFLQRLATRILELDRGRITDWPGDYENYLRRRDERLHAEAQANAQFDRRLAEEEVWIRQGIKARRTRNQGRVRALEAMRDERRSRVQRTGNARLRLGEADRSGKLVVEAESVDFAWEDQAVIKGLSTLILRGDKVGIIGPNGSGKSTLLRLLLGELLPGAGRIRRGTGLQVAYFDQLRAQLEPERTVRDNVAEGSDHVEVDGKRRHVISYLADFLFTPERANQPVKALSGGERNRLLLAKLFTRPANLLVLDEPTNDLDAETLELLEELLSNFAGTLLLVSHDRALLDNLVTSSLVLEGGGRVREYVGGYSDWLRQRPAASDQRSRADSSSEQAADRTADQAAERAKKQPRPRRESKRLGYMEGRELAVLPARIEALEAELEALQARLADPALYRDGGEAVAETREHLAAAESELAGAYARWEELESRA